MAVIVATSKMDELVGFLVRQRLLPCSSKKDDLLDSERGLGTFSNRIDLAFRLGVIDSSLVRALHLFRKIRNDFAHAYEGQNLNVSPHRDRVEELENQARTHPNVEVIRNAISTAPITLTDEKKSFIIAATYALAKLETAKLLVRQVDTFSAPHITFP
ncbi:hypothetical protein Pla52nx_000031 [Stieleria varia]|uniref:hypothetical protein n=1 Tax=Stieleria varia TaxID=2528005 RepID=UPI00313F1566